MNNNFTVENQRRVITYDQPHRPMQYWLVAMLMLTTWLMASPMAFAEHILSAVAPSAQPGQSATLLPDGRWLLIGGKRNGVSTETVEIRDSRTNKAITLPAGLTVARTQHSATLLPDGRVLVLGGVGADGKVIAAAELFNPANQRFEGIATELLPRAGHTATLLTDSRVLVTGGWNAQAGLLNQAELWNSRTGEVEKFSGPARAGHSAKLLADGRVLIEGGMDTAGHPLSTTVLFDPQQNRFVDGAISSAIETSAPPSLAGSIPAAEAQDFPVDGVIALRFSKPLDPATLDDSTVTLIGPSGVTPIRIISAEGGRLGFVMPKQDLFPLSWYSLFVQGARDIEGRALPFVTLGFATPSLNTASSDSAEFRGPTSLSSPGSSYDAANPAGGSSNAQDAQSSQSGPVQGKAVAPVNDSNPLSVAPNIISKATKNDASDDEIFKPGEQNKGGHWHTGRAQLDELRHRHNEALSELSKAAARREGRLRSSETMITGIALKINDKPLAQVKVSVGSQVAITNQDGEFSLSGIPAGRQELIVDGRPAGDLTYEYGRFVIGVDVEAGQENPIAPIYLPKIRKSDWIDLPSPVPADTIVRTPDVPGMELHIPKGAVLRDRDGKIVTKIALVPLPLDRSPFPFPENAPVYVSVQPGGMIVQGLTPSATKGIRVIYPNLSNTKPGERVVFWRYDSKGAGWGTYGEGSASADGTQIVPDPGVALYESIGFMYTQDNPPPPPNNPPCGDDNSCGGGSGGSGGSGSGPGTDGDPVDLSSGLFLHYIRYLELRDTMPLTFRGVYRPGDPISRPFGYGHSHPYAVYLREVSGTPTRYQQYDLITADGSFLRYYRTSPGSSLNDVMAEYTGSPSSYYKSIFAYQNGNYVITKKDGSKLEFSLYGQLLNMRDRSGNRIEFTRTNGQIARITTQSGRYLDFTYDASNRITQIKDIAGRIWSYTYNASGLLSSVTFPDNTTEQYTYDAGGRMLTVVDRRGITMVTNQYDSNGRVTQQTLADGGVYRFTYTTDVNNQITQTDVTNPLGQVRRVVFHSSRYPASDTRAFGTPLAQAMVYTRDAVSGFVTAAVDSLGRNTTYTYDAKGNITSVTRLAGTASAVTDSYTYTADYNQLATSKNPLGHTSTYSYDSLGRLTQLQDPLGNLSKFTYNGAGQVLTVTNPLNKVTTFSYDLGDLRSVTDPLNRTTTYFTDVLGRTASVTDPLGNKTLYTYDSLDRPIQITDPLNQSTTLSYDGNSNLLKVTDPKASATQYGYDARNRLSSQTDPLLKSETYQYDGNGNLTRSTDRKSQITNYTYDARNRRTQTSFADASTTTYTYDAGDRLTALNDSQSGAFSRNYDGLNRLTQETSPQGSMSYSYDSASRRTGMTVAGQTAITYTYDNASRLTKITQGTTSTLYTYDAASRRTSLTLPNGIVTSYSYDSASQLTGLSYAKGATSLGTLLYSYDTLGRRISTTGTLAGTGLPASLASATHNANHQLTQADAQALSYDANGNLLSDGANTYTWDARNRLSALSGPQTASFKYDPLGRRIQKTLAGVTTQFLYDGANSVQEQGPAVTPTDTVWVEDALPAGAVANPISTTNESWSWVSSNPTSFSGSLAHQSLIQSGTHQHYFTNATATLSVNPGDTLCVYVYLDPANPPSEVMLQWYDSANSWEHRAYWGANLIAYGTNGTNSRRYMGALPAAGQWVRLEVPASLVGLEGMTVKGMAYSLYNGRATWDKAGKVSSGSGTVNYLTGLGIDERLARSDSSGAQSYLTDALGSTIALTDSLGAIQTRYSYEPFGKTTASGVTSSNPYQYTGRENDGTGLYYYRARYYSPSLQRFVSSDPIGLRGGINTYTYVGGNPISLTDPFGLLVNICFYADAAMGFGHIGFGFPGEPGTQGYYPTGNPFNSPGQVKRDQQAGGQCKGVSSSPSQDTCMSNCRLSKQSNPGQYQLFSNQCTSFVRDCMQECGLNSGSYMGPEPLPFFNQMPSNPPFNPILKHY